MKWPGEGIKWDLDEAAYHSVEAYSNSLGTIIRNQTLLDARESFLHPSEATEAMVEGTATHIACLEPGDYTSRVCGPLLINGERVARRSNDDKALWKEYEAKNADKLMVPSLTRIEACRKAVHAQPTAHALIHHPKARTEVSIFWICKETGARCKGRLDLLTMMEEWPAIVDLKTAAGYVPATPFNPRPTGGLNLDMLRSVAASRDYDAGAWNYMDGANSVAEVQRRFFHIWVTTPPKKRPHMSSKVRVTEVNAQMLEIGEHKTMKARRLYVKAMESGEWPAWADDTPLLGVPAWEMRKYEEELDDE